ncbi:hypothetical protein SacglDRAFT_01615 [Saccharomonospora glauca K62]|uniref:Uncharacterized protein n=2 Tax=Saccharomonospora glauca TaxID=40990 RepID=I1D0Q6_9PSEU|nr:hypothetical protein SacglDRAFT_01615 [Saccharomonospora glauca K62]
MNGVSRTEFAGRFAENRLAEIVDLMDVTTDADFYREGRKLMSSHEEKRMSIVEKFANSHVDETLRPLQVGSVAGPVLATPAYAGYAAGAFTLGLITDLIENHHATEVTPTGPVPESGSADELLGMRVESIR